MAGLVHVGGFPGRVDAELAVTYLGEHGIRAIVLADDLGGTHPHIALGAGGVALGVLPEDAERARELLASPLVEDAAAGARDARPLRPVAKWMLRIAAAVVAGMIVMSALPSR